MSDDIDLIKHRMRSARTLEGVGGAKLWNIPGVVYPDEMLAHPHKRHRVTLVSAPPKNYISSAAAAAMLGNSRSACRAYLHKHRVRSVMVAQRGGAAVNYYPLRSVQRLAESRPPIVTEPPAGCIDSAATRALLQVGRSTLFRYIQRGRLEEIKVRYRAKGCTREKEFYPLEQVQKLAARAAKARALTEAYEKALAELNDI